MTIAVPNPGDLLFPPEECFFYVALGARLFVIDSGQSASSTLDSSCVCTGAVLILSHFSIHSDTAFIPTITATHPALERGT